MSTLQTAAVFVVLSAAFVLVIGVTVSAVLAHFSELRDDDAG